MKKQSLIRLFIVAIIISAAFFVVAATRSSNRAAAGKQDCTDEKSCDQKEQSEFFLESLTRSLLSK